MGADALPEEIDGLLAFAEDCSLTVNQARERMSRIAASLAGWRNQARNNRIAEREISMMAQSIEPRVEAVAGASRSPV